VTRRGLPDIRRIGALRPDSDGQSGSPSLPLSSLSCGWRIRGRVVEIPYLIRQPARASQRPGRHSCSWEVECSAAGREDLLYVAGAPAEPRSGHRARLRLGTTTGPGTRQCALDPPLECRTHAGEMRNRAATPSEKKTTPTARTQLQQRYSSAPPLVAAHLADRLGLNEPARLLAFAGAVVCLVNGLLWLAIPQWVFLYYGDTWGSFVPF